jgi:GTP-binding protein
MAAHDFTAEELAAGEALFARSWQFVRSVPSLEFLPPPDRIEMAFAGRSNVGKSSLLNALVGQRGLARTSNTPGRTQELNYFEVPGATLFLVDMPGYGFAKAPKEKVDAWTGLVKDYLRGRAALVRVFLLIDSRHGLKPPDLAMMELMDEAAVSYQAVLTKADKIKPHELERVAARTAEELARHAAAYAGILATSSEKGTGIAALRAELARLAAAHGALVAG